MKKTLSLFLALVIVAGAVHAGGAAEPKKAPGGVEKELTIWSGAAEDEAQALSKKFTSLHPEITVSIIRAGSGELVNRLAAEQPKPAGDILLMIAKENMEIAYEHLAPTSR